MNHVQTLFLTVLCLLALPVVVWTRSRASLVGVVAGLGLFFLLLGVKYRARYVVYTLFSVLLIMGTSLLVTRGGSEALAEWDVSGVRSTLDGRIHIWRNVWAEAKQHLWFGIDYSNESYQSVISYHVGPHNLYLDYVVKTGLVGFAGFLALVGTFSFRTVKLLLTSRLTDRSIMVLSCFSALVGGYLVRGAVAQYYPFFDWAVLVSLYYVLLLPRSSDPG